MYRFLVQRVQNGCIYTLWKNKEATCSFQDFLLSMSKGTGPVMDVFLQALRECPFRAFFLETPGVCGASASDTPFQMVLLDAPELVGVVPDKTVFREHFRNSNEIARFLNLGGDAMLFVPSTVYPDMASFSRDAPVALQRALWSRVATFVRKECFRVDPLKPFWISTSGLGVHWLHVRVDTVPKYIRWKRWRGPPNAPDRA